MEGISKRRCLSFMLRNRTVWVELFLVFLYFWFLLENPVFLTLMFFVSFIPLSFPFLLLFFLPCPNRIECFLFFLGSDSVPSLGLEGATRPIRTAPKKVCQLWRQKETQCHATKNQPSTLLENRNFQNSGVDFRALRTLKCTQMPV